jgi:two-component system chemotaxis response regulator CheY
MSEPVGYTKSTYAGLKVMVVEDDDGTRRLIRRMLQQIGIETVIECADGLRGVQEVLRTKPDAVFCDIHMAPVNGNEFLKMLRDAKIGWVKRLPIVFLTSDSQQESVVAAVENQVDGYLVKPVSMSVLKARVDTIIAKMRAEEELRNAKL